MPSIVAAQEIVAFTLGGLLSFACGCAREPSEETLADGIEKARAYVEELRDRNGAPAFAVAVAINGEIVWSQGFGFADVERQIPATAQTVFRVGSISKVFTAAAVARLVEQGKLDLDAPVQRYVPEFPDKGHLITTRQLTGHLSGVRHYRWGEQRPTERYDDVLDALAFFKDDPVEFPPGSRFSYSSYGWVLVSAVVQRAADTPFLEYMSSEVFERLGMPHTRPETNDMESANRATLYEKGRPIAADEISYILAAGGFLSTVEDMARFGSAFLPGGAFFKPEILETLFARQSTRDGEPTRFGIGWMVDELTNETPVYYHPGTVTGGHAALLVNPRERIVVAMAANQSSGFGSSDCQRVACEVMRHRDCPEIVGETGRRLTKSIEVPELLDVLHRWERAMKSGDVHGVVGTLSANFTSTLWTGRSDLNRRLRAGGLEVDAEDVHLRAAGWDVGAVVRVEGVLIGSDQSTIKVVIQVAREESGWKILSIQREE